MNGVPALGTLVSPVDTDYWHKRFLTEGYNNALVGIVTEHLDDAQYAMVVSFYPLATIAYPQMCFQSFLFRRGEVRIRRDLEQVLVHDTTMVAKRLKNGKLQDIGIWWKVPAA